jgi:hypothetical protein
MYATPATTRSPVNSLTMPPLSREERLLCDTLKPKNAAPFRNDTSAFAVKVSVVGAGVVTIDIASDGKATFTGKMQPRRMSQKLRYD